MTLCACAALPWLSQAVYADTKPSVESFFADPNISDVVISPRGEHVAVLMKSAKGGESIVVRDTADLKNGTIVTSTKDDKIYDINWVNEDRLTFTVRAALRDIYEGNQDEMAVDRDGQNMTHLISGDFRHTRESTGTNVKSKILTWDYAFHSTLHDGSDDIVVEKYKWNQVDAYSPESSHLFRLNTRTRELKDIPIGKSPELARYWMLDAHGVPRIAFSEIEGQCMVHYLPPGGEAWEQLSKSGCYSEEFNPIRFDGDDHLVVKKSYKGFDALYRYDLKTHKIDDAPFLSLDGFDFRGTIEVDTVTNTMIGIHFDSDAESTAWFDPKYKQLQAKIDALLPQTVNRISCGADCFHSPAIMVTSSSDRQPAQFMIYNIEKNNLVSLGSTHPDIKPAQMGLRDFYRFKARDGMPIPIYVTTPPGKPAKPLPTVVLVHGGPWLRGSSWEWDSEAQFLASRGYLVLQPEFRGSMGYGDKLFRAGWRQWGQSMQDDLADAAQWAIREHNADPKRIGIMGASYGGYATLMGLIKEPQLFRAGVEWAGVTDSGLMYSLSESDMPVNSMKYDWKLMMGDPNKDAAMFKQYSPLENAAKLTQPLLIAHGACRSLRRRPSMMRSRGPTRTSNG